MSQKSQIFHPTLMIALAALCTVPSCLEAGAIIWGEAHGMTGKALRDGLDFWGGGFLALHGHLATLFDVRAYQGFFAGLYGKLPYHMWSYPPTYLLVALPFGWLPPWPAVLCFDLLSLLLLALLLRLAGKSRWFIAAVLASPASLENLMEHQNAALLTALIGGGLLLLPRRPRLAGVLIGLATIKPQLGLALPLFLLRRRPVAFVMAVASALALAALSWLALGSAAWAGFWHITRPAMSAVLLTDQPPAFAAGLISVFASFRFLGVPAALLVQGVASAIAILLSLRAGSPIAVLLLTALACPYLHDYDLLGATLAVALLVERRLTSGFAPFEALLCFLAWFGPGLLPWAPQFAHATPFLLVALLASAMRRGGLKPSCDSSLAPPASPVLSAGRLPIPAPPDSTAPG
ncbi:MAG TPA: glycosyltransferase 87 family protein [Acidocella sp.]|nr:glycosyltransferase 87 family protein [Acidocella sp.]